MDLKQAPLDFGLNEGAVDGMKRAADHAESDQPGWAGRAMQFLVAYIRLHPGEQLIAPDVRKWAQAAGLDDPPTNYAWGGVFYSARRAGLIKPEGYGQYGDAVMHTQSVRVWRAL